MKYEWSIHKWQPVSKVDIQVFVRQPLNKALMRVVRIVARVNVAEANVEKVFPNIYCRCGFFIDLLTIRALLGLKYQTAERKS